MPPTAPSNPGSTVGAAQVARQALRQRLLADRERFDTLPDALPAHDALAGHLARLLRQIEPEQLGVYWPIRSEFNAISALEAASLPKLPLALPYAQRKPPEMHYRSWDGQTPAGVDECGLPTPAVGPAVVPDVVLVPCVGYTRSGFRLGYGGGYFDRWLAQYPQVTAIGVAWSLGEIADDAFAPQPHDRPLMVVLTERGVVV
jgi:5-formyltetrahydrofolate cyclo-ligase